MTETDLKEAVALVTRWKKRDALKLLASERYYIKNRLYDMHIQLDEDNHAPKSTA